MIRYPAYAVYDEPTYQPAGSRLQRFLQALSASVRLGQPFGVEVRLLWISLIVPLFIYFEMGAVSYLSLTARIGLALAWSALLFLVIYVHEMGHIAAGWRYRIPSRKISLSPMGGLAHMETAAPNPKADAIVSLAGPATHLLWLLPLAPLYVYRGELFGATNWQAIWLIDFMFWLNVSLLVFNLLPFYPMDGGRVLRALLCSKLHPNRAQIVTAYVGIAGAIGIGIFALVMGELWGVILIVIAISNVLACMQALVAAKYQESPYAGPGETLAAWQSDPDAWKQGQPLEAWGGGHDDDDGDGERSARRRRGKGKLRRWLDRRRQVKQKELAEELDRILAKINQVGLDGITRRERKILERASKEARKR